MKDKRKVFSQIYDKYIDKIYRFIFLKVNSQQIAEDLSSEAFTRCWEFLNKKNSDIENPQAFLYKIARNLITDHYREKGRTQIVSTDCLPIVDPKNDIEERVRTESDMDTIRFALQGLKDEYREVVALHYLDDLSIPETAKILNKPEATVRVILHRALKALKNKIEES